MSARVCFVLPVKTPTKFSDCFIRWYFLYSRRDNHKLTFLGRVRFYAMQSSGGLCEFGCLNTSKALRKWLCRNFLRRYFGNFLPLSACKYSFDTFLGGHLPFAFLRPFGDLHIAIKLCCFLLTLGMFLLHHETFRFGRMWDRRIRFTGFLRQLFGTNFRYTLAVCRNVYLLWGDFLYRDTFCGRCGLFRFYFSRPLECRLRHSEREGPLAYAHFFLFGYGDLLGHNSFPFWETEDINFLNR